jgi:hypothetical protein
VKSRIKANGAQMARWAAVALIVGRARDRPRGGLAVVRQDPRVAAEQQRLEKVLAGQWGAVGSPARRSGAPAGGSAAAAARPRAGAGRRRTARRRGGAGGGAAAVGTPIARLHMPTISKTLGGGGGRRRQAARPGPGRMTDTAPLGEPGNTALAGHRYPGLFWNLDLIEVGDPIVVETADSWLVYRAVRHGDRRAGGPDGARAAAGEHARAADADHVRAEAEHVPALVKQAMLVRSDPRGGRPRRSSTAAHPDRLT